MGIKVIGEKIETNNNIECNLLEFCLIDFFPKHCRDHPLPCGQGREGGDRIIELFVCIAIPSTTIDIVSGLWSGCFRIYITALEEYPKIEYPKIEYPKMSKKSNYPIRDVHRGRMNHPTTLVLF